MVMIFLFSAFLLKMNKKAEKRLFLTIISYWFCWTYYCRNLFG